MSDRHPGVLHRSLAIGLVVFLAGLAVVSDAAAQILRVPQQGRPSIIVNPPQGWATFYDSAGNLVLEHSDRHLLQVMMSVATDTASSLEAVASGFDSGSVFGKYSSKQAATVAGRPGMSFMYPTMNGSHSRQNLVLTLVRLDPADVAILARITTTDTTQAHLRAAEALYGKIAFDLASPALPPPPSVSFQNTPPAVRTPPPAMPAPTAPRQTLGQLQPSDRDGSIKFMTFSDGSRLAPGGEIVLGRFVVRAAENFRIASVDPNYDDKGTKAISAWGLTCLNAQGASTECWMRFHVPRSAVPQCSLSLMSPGSGFDFACPIEMALLSPDEIQSHIRQREQQEQQRDAKRAEDHQRSLCRIRCSNERFDCTFQSSAQECRSRQDRCVSSCQ